MKQLATTCYSKLTLFWQGPFVLYLDHVRALPAHQPGVYVLAAFTVMAPTLVPFYVGQSASLRRRLFEHLGGTVTFARHLRNRLSTYFCVAVVSDPLLRTMAEAALICSLKPAGNAALPAAPMVLVTLPPLSLLDI
jgi:hypothetical protein